MIRFVLCDSYGSSRGYYSEPDQVIAELRDMTIDDRRGAFVVTYVDIQSSGASSALDFIEANAG